MGNWKPWVYPAHWSIDEHNAVLSELRKAEAELDRMGKANNEACDRIAELETQLDIVTLDRDHYRDEYQPVSAARDAAEAHVRELEAPADPDAWKTPLRIEDVNGDTIQTAFADKESVIVSVTSNTSNVELTPHSAARAALEGEANA